MVLDKRAKNSFFFVASFLVMGLLLSCKDKKKDYKDYGRNFKNKLQTADYRIPPGPFAPDWHSLSKHQAAPDWFRDAKFGIYAHWGVYSVPAYHNSWYPYYMYNKETGVYKYHVKTYGSPLKFGYPDFVPLFKGEHFDANPWAKLYKQAGARFAGPVAEHHDGFAMWDTEWTPWNAKDMGPHRNVVGELEKAIRAQGMHFIATFHHAKNGLWKKDGKWVGHFQYVKKDFPSLLKDAKRDIMYGYLPRPVFLEKWRGELEEVVNHYHPDLIWFDGKLGYIPDSVREQFLAFYFNKAAQSGKEVVVTFKHDQLPREVGVEDFERGRADKILPVPWLTDDAIGDNAWAYVKGLQLKTSDYIIDELADIVSKNGDLLLNISPKSDGTIPADQQKILLEIGSWLNQNGSAIYGTRPWKVFGEGPTKLKKGGAFVKKISYTAQDIRYTQKSDTVYAIELGWPGAHKKILLKAWAADSSNEKINIASITVLGSEEAIHWSLKKNGLELTTPASAPDRNAIVFKIVTGGNKEKIF